MWQVSDMRHLICQLISNEIKRTELACNLCIVVVASLKFSCQLIWQDDK